MQMSRLSIEPTSSQVAGSDKEAMFEKPLTPSDVGKLNRLVIPKQYAEKYFPVAGSDAGAPLLGLEDEAGKRWQFRYSYWSSSQSYVLTRGWSRYVKDNSLHAGDVVVFQRHRSYPQRLFITWRRRGATYQPRRLALALGGANQEEEERTAENNNSPPPPPTRLVRLFGVNFECHQQSSSRTTSSHSQHSSHQYHTILLQAQQQQQQEAYYRNYFHNIPHPNYAHHYRHMETEFAQGGVLRQMGNHLG